MKRTREIFFAVAGNSSPTAIYPTSSFARYSMIRARDAAAAAPDTDASTYVELYSSRKIRCIRLVPW